MSRLHGPVALGVLLGLSAWLLTGEPGPGAFVAVIVVAAAVIISRTHFVGPGQYYLLGGFLLFVLFLSMKFGGRHGPTAWHDLQQEFSTDRQPPRMERQRKVHLLRRTSQFTIKPYSYRRVSVALGRDGIDLRASWPQTLVYRSLHIPLQRLVSCRSDHSLFAGHTLVEIQYPMVDVGLPDADGRVLAWCRESGLAGEEPSSG